MATSSYIAQDQVQQMIAQVKTLTVEKLKNLLRVENLTVGGVKSELQIRTIARMLASLHLGLPRRLTTECLFQTLKNSVM